MSQTIMSCVTYIYDDRIQWCNINNLVNNNLLITNGRLNNSYETFSELVEISEILDYELKAIPGVTTQQQWPMG